jgi:hypothetical protein
MKTKNPNKNLIRWLSDDRARAYFGRVFSVRADVLAHLLSHSGTLADIGRTHGISRQAVFRHHQRAHRIYTKPSTGG